ncbi:beta-1,3-galactosyl-O-glycosyl-glycoprotein beta-1,6-N-acetylglucosaminyltransferase-like [Argopecten irradians]|uniref:beta-1,3-galactosyl-O-glycosyl-glycoprotein beta-1,6-N-acetylglucosaminyltransferase-like n=1 Tax=Argopecten irradians TaxID=31199 RepID=UPI0037243A39
MPFYRKYTQYYLLIMLAVCVLVVFRFLQTSSTKRNFIKYQLPSTSIRNASMLDYFPYQRIPVDINCKGLFDGKESEFLKADSWTNLNTSQFISDQAYITDTADCTTFIKSRGYITKPLTMEEELYSIAYSFVVYEDANQVERLLRALYQPQNYYCIHMDDKSQPDFRRAVSGVAKCFDNVLISSVSVSVLRKSFTVLQPDLICMEDLWKYKNWKYFMNLAGNEFPLRTNLELVRILKTLNGSNHIQGILKRANTDRWEKAGLPPHDIRPIKGSMHIVAIRAFVEYALHNPIALEFLEWTKHTSFPEETFFSSLHYNAHLNVPGAFKGSLEEVDDGAYFGRFVNWLNWIDGTDKFKSEFDCKGKFIHGICVFGVRDLPLIISRPELFVNKLYRYYQPYAFDCMEELLFNRTREGYLSKQSANTNVDTRQYADSS